MAPSLLFLLVPESREESESPMYLRGHRFRGYRRGKTGFFLLITPRDAPIFRWIEAFFRRFLDEKPSLRDSKARSLLRVLWGASMSYGHLRESLGPVISGLIYSTVRFTAKLGRQVWGPSSKGIIQARCNKLVMKLWVKVRVLIEGWLKDLSRAVTDGVCQSCEMSRVVGQDREGSLEMIWHLWYLWWESWIRVFIWWVLQFG